MATTKRCPDCGTDRLLSDFHRKGSGVQGYCKTHQKQRAIVAMWKRAGINLDWPGYEALRARQNNQCAICDRQPPATAEPEKALAVDHDRATNRIRGLLCMNCNTGIGKLNHDINLLRRACEYLTQPVPSGEP